jgi:cytochrome c oxidase subunit 1
LGIQRRSAILYFGVPGTAQHDHSFPPSAIGGFILLASGILFLVILACGMRAPQTDAGPYRFALAVHQPATVPVALNTHALWVGLMIALTLTNYGYPILTLALNEGTSVPAVYVGAQ